MSFCWLFFFCLCFFLLMMGKKGGEVYPSILFLSFKFAVFCFGFIPSIHYNSSIFLGFPSRPDHTIWSGTLTLSELPSRGGGCYWLAPSSLTGSIQKAPPHTSAAQPVIFLHLFSSNRFCLALTLTSLLRTESGLQFAYCLILSLLRAWSLGLCLVSRHWLTRMAAHLSRCHFLCLPCAMFSFWDSSVTLSGSLIRRAYL